jgi:hypothetical protein
MLKRIVFLSRMITKKTDGEGNEIVLGDSFVAIMG